MLPEDMAFGKSDYKAWSFLIFLEDMDIGYVPENMSFGYVPSRLDLPSLTVRSSFTDYTYSIYSIQFYNYDSLRGLAI